MAEQVVCVPVDPAGQVEPRWGRAPRVVVAHLQDGVVTDWIEHEVRWDALHEQRAEGLHHAGVARFLQDQHVTDVVVQHVGPGMEHMLARMGLRVHLGAEGLAREAVTRAVN